MHLADPCGSQTSWVTLCDRSALSASTQHKARHTLRTYSKAGHEAGCAWGLCLVLGHEVQKALTPRRCFHDSQCPAFRRIRDGAHSMRRHRIRVSLHGDARKLSGQDRTSNVHARCMDAQSCRAPPELLSCAEGAGEVCHSAAAES